MSRFHDRHHYHNACGHWCDASLCDPTAHTVKCVHCRLDEAVKGLDDKPQLRVESAHGRLRDE